MLLFNLILICSTLSYLLGSIPTGYLLGKKKGIDLRKAGSKSTGATNALRLLGKKAGFFVLLIDCSKGSLALLLSIFFFESFAQEIKFFNCSLLDLRALVFLLSSVFVIFGHSRSIWIDFQGGKSVATGAGVMLVINWKVALLCILSWLLILYLFKISSLAAIGTVVLLPIYMYLFEFLFLANKKLQPCPKINSFVYLIIATFSTLFILFKHRENIKRLLRKEEPKVSFLS